MVTKAEEEITGTIALIERNIHWLQSLSSHFAASGHPNVIVNPSSVQGIVTDLTVVKTTLRQILESTNGSNGTPPAKPPAHPGAVESAGGG